MDDENESLKKHLLRLQRITVPNAIYFVTTCCQKRSNILDNSEVVAILQEEWMSALKRHGWLIGRYVIMPDHVHFFCMAHPSGAKQNLSQFVGQWKQWTAKRFIRELSMEKPVWQAGFFDHVLRSQESYIQKWAYVRENPVRAGLVEVCSDWPWQGRVDFDFPR